ncbi:MAG: EAL domain-containing protein [Legionellales bacterium]|nr:EAL domain-containing protein [Legionellales bacterium]
MSVDNIGLDLEDRLEFIGIEISFIANSISKTNFKKTPQLDSIFNNLYLKGSDDIRPLTDSPILEYIKKLKIPPKITKPTLIIIDKTIPTNIIVIAPIQNKNYHLVGEINQNFLWQLQEIPLSSKATLCITTSHKNIACLNNLESIVFNKIQNISDYHSVTWNKFNTPSLNIPNLEIISWVSSNAILADTLPFMWLKIIAILTAIILIFIIGSRLILNITSPIKRAKKYLERYISLDPLENTTNENKNELETLVNTLEYFQGEIDSQHASRSAMAKIDKIILSSLDLNSIMDTLKKRLKKIMMAEKVYIHIKSIKRTKIHDHIFKTYGQDMSDHGFILSKNEIQLIFKNPHHILIDTIQNKNFKQLTDINNTVFILIIPIFLDENITALISLNYQEIPSYTQESLTLARELANRFAVAIANAAREDKLYYQAHYDLLTDLPNRLLFEERLEEAIYLSNKTNCTLAILFIDLDKFKSLNDSLGHAAGDEYLKNTANRIKNCLRSDDTVARFGGDEFIVILSNLKNDSLVNHISSVTEKIQHEIAKPHKILGNSVVLNSSIGIAVYPEDADNSTDLLKAADAALYYSKSHKSGNYQFFSIDISKEAKELFFLENNLNNAVVNNEFELHFQPRINLDSNKVVGAEALIRWQKNKAYISPENFIPIAENNGLIQSVGEWILRNACLTAKKWHSLNVPIRVSINLSAKQFQNTALITRIQDILSECELSPTFLELEITENILMENNKHTIALLHKLQDMGIIIAIDDFGTGYSSLNYLRNFSIDVIKIDQSFIKNIHNEQVNKAIVSAILTLADNLNIKAVAEGVENHNELKWLVKHNCKEIQGYLFSAPLNENEFENFILKNHLQIPETAKNLT